MLSPRTYRVLVSFSVLLIGLVLSRASMAAEEPKAEPKWTVYKEWPFDGAEAKRRQAETAKALGVKVEQVFELAPGVKITMVLIPAGEFLIGSPESEDKRGGSEDQKRVVIKKPFWMGKHELTQAQWKAVTGSNPSRFKGDRDSPTRPVEQVSWEHVQDFLKKVNARHPGTPFALPTEAQWEYACRAGTATPFHFGETLSTDQANYDGNYPYGGGDKGLYRRETMPVGSFPANAWGLRDVHGNVCEWCASPFAGSYDGTESKGAEAPGDMRARRGGSWGDIGRACRSASRINAYTVYRKPHLGFRVSRVVGVASPRP